MLRRRDLIILSMIPIIVAITLAALIIMLVTDNTGAPFHPMQLRTV
jgi:hypothetical protein